MMNNEISLESYLRNDRVKEQIYSFDHPLVIEWTDYFSKRAEIPSMFKGIWEEVKHPKAANAIVVGSLWNQFSAWVPKLLVLGAAKVSNNLLRHYLVQIVFEELGGRDENEIHSRLFEESIRQIGLDRETENQLVQMADLSFFDLHYNEMNNSQSDSHVLGLNLGLEINAEENIDTLFRALAYNGDAHKLLENSMFFRIHRVVEEEHIRLNVANFLKFCPSDNEKDAFILGFDKSIKFWNSFWSLSTRLIKDNLNHIQLK
jgi:hypothetical protein